ncbi:hypothetical protein AMS68_003183 [Peltaster fructicola]|uniref:Uncharacterized protein n=1 Tax=Peltaster fructicola TaxID=286661 RepID=A0A6H0XSL1_9PEZI|nr:hypothetical protein AMS68_003183 [Peltaster fructicola]
MSTLSYHNYQGYGEWAKGALHYSQAVRVGKDIIEASGQGGWDPNTKDLTGTMDISTDLATQIEQAFSNVDLALRTAGGKGWEQVYKVRTYYVSEPGTVIIPEEVMKLLTDGLRKWAPNHQPIWTALGVAALTLPNMRIEIEVKAYDHQS